MDELKQMVSRLRKALAEKEIEIAERETTPDGNLYSLLDNRKSEIDFFERSANLVTVSIAEKPKVIANFEKDATRIEAGISQIGK
jgi:DNA-binding SARP family transcriptional activator